MRGGGKEHVWGSDGGAPLGKRLRGAARGERKASDGGSLVGAGHSKPSQSAAKLLLDKIKSRVRPRRQ